MFPSALGIPLAETLGIDGFVEGRFANFLQKRPWSFLRLQAELQEKTLQSLTAMMFFFECFFLFLTICNFGPSKNDNLTLKPLVQLDSYTDMAFVFIARDCGSSLWWASLASIIFCTVFCQVPTPRLVVDRLMR